MACLLLINRLRKHFEGRRYINNNISNKEMKNKIKKSDKVSIFSMVNGWTFFPPLIFTVLLSAIVMANPIGFGKILETDFAYVTDSFAWMFSWYFLVLCVVVLYLAFGPLGKNILAMKSRNIPRFPGWE